MSNVVELVVVVLVVVAVVVLSLILLPWWLFLPNICPYSKFHPNWMKNIETRPRFWPKMGAKGLRAQSLK